MTIFAQALSSTARPKATIVFLPGGGLSGWSWRPVAERLPEYRSLLVDLPEHGRSSNVGPFTMHFAADEVKNLIQERGGGNAHIVGISLGAQVIIQMLASTPEIIQTAFLSGCSLLPIAGLGNRTLLKLIFGLYRPFQNIPWLVRANARQIGVPKEYEGSFADDTRSLSPTMLARIVSANQTFRLPMGIKGVSTPTLITVGEKELGTVKRSAKDLVANLPNAKAYEVEGQNHAWTLSNPELCASAIKSFLSGTPIPLGLRLL
jgi:pimeloyl-ACP methyl ester carboxylesterase